MLNLKSVEKTKKGLVVVYEVIHTSPESRTTLSENLHLTIDPTNGAVEGELQITGLTANSLEAGLEKLADWLDRLAAGLREPMKVTASVPVFAKNWDIAVPTPQSSPENSD